MSRKLAHSPKFWAACVVFLILVLIVYYSLLDRYTPITSDAYVQAYVTQIAPQVDGIVTTVGISDNQRVQAGQLLFELDARPYAYVVDQLDAELALARKEVALLEQDLKLANDMISLVQADLALAKDEFGRYSTAAKSGALPMLQVDQATNKVSDKRALLQSKLADREKVKASLAAKIGDENALIAKAESNLNKARYDLAQTKIVAPSDGYITNLQLTSGTYIKAGTAVMTFVDLQDWWIVANFRENSLALMHPGQRAEVTLAMYPGRIFGAVVESVGWGVSQGQGVPSGDLPIVETPTDWVKFARRFPVRLRLDAAEAEIDMRVGGSATVVVYTSENLVLNAVARLWLNIASVLNFVY